MIRISEFLAAFRNPNEAVCLRAFKAKGAPDSRANAAKKWTTTPSDLTSNRALQRELIEKNRVCGMYFVVNFGGDEDKDINRYTAWIVENDSRTLAEQHEKLDSCALRPSIRVETRKSVHAYWLVEGDCSEAEWRNIQSRLIAYFDGDESIRNPSRVMRLPEFDHLHLNRNRLERKKVTVHTFEAERRYTVAEIMEAFPATENDRGSQERQRACNGRFEYHEDRHAELGQRIMARGKRNRQGHWDARGICHNGKGDKGLVYFPTTTAVWCNNRCDYLSILAAEGLSSEPLPSKPSEKTGKPNPQPEQWELPAAFYEFDLPIFPVGALPTWLREFVQGLSIETQTPLDLAAMLALSVIAGAVAGKVRVQARRGWTEPTNLYCVVAMAPGSRKSAVFAAMCEPLEEVERTLVEETRDEVAQAASEYRMLEQKRDRLEREAAKAEELGEQISKRDEAIKCAQELATLKVPFQPRLIADDVTPETLATLLAEHDGRMCLFSAEGGLFDILAGRYTGGAPNLEVILKGHSGDNFRVDRRGRSEFVPHPALTIGLTVQPVVIRGLVDKQGFRGRGLIARFLYSLPRSTVGERLIAAAPVRDDVRQTYKENVKALARLEPALDCNDLPVARMLWLAREANDLLKQFEAELEPQLAEDAELGTTADWASKLAGAVVRIVSILQLAKHAQELTCWPERISAECMVDAITIGRYLIQHAKAAFAEMGADPQVETAKLVLRWILRTGQPSFSQRDAHQAHKSRFPKVADIEPPLELLTAHGYIRPRSDDGEQRRGRKRSQVFDVNPFLFSVSQNSQNPQNYPPDGNSEDSENCETGKGLEKFVSMAPTWTSRRADSERT